MSNTCMWFFSLKGMFKRYYIERRWVWETENTECSRGGSQHSSEMYITIHAVFIWGVISEAAVCRQISEHLYRSLSKQQYGRSVINSVIKFFRSVILLYLYKEPQPLKTPDGLTSQARNRINWKPQPKIPIQDTNPKTLSHHKWANMRPNMLRITLGKIKR